MTATTAPASASRTLAERAAILRGRGWAPRQAEWLALVCLHSGVFTRSQYQARYGVSQPVASRFVTAILEAGIAREEPMPDRRCPQTVCHIYNRTLYRVLGIENNRHRRSGSPELIMRRLLSLDYVLEHHDLAWLPTEPEKVAYFQRLGMSVAILPQRQYRGPFSARSTRRYFAFKLPVAGNGTTTTFVFADTGGRHRVQSDRIRSWAAAHAALWEALRHRRCVVHIVAVTRTDDAAAANAAILETWRGAPAPAASRSEADQQLLDEVELANSTGDLSPLDKYGGWLEAGKAALHIKQRAKDAHAAASYIDAYSTHVAERLAPDVLAL